MFKNTAADIFSVSDQVDLPIIRLISDLRSFGELLGWCDTTEAQASYSHNYKDLKNRAGTSVEGAQGMSEEGCMFVIILLNY